MKLSIKERLLALVAVPVCALSIAGAVAPVASAEGNISLGGGVNSAKGDDQAACLFGNEAGCDGGTPIFKVITNVLLFIIGAISVIMLVIGGIRYTTSAGDSSAVKAAKDTILYAIVGIVVALLAFAVVNFVVGAFMPSS